MMTRNNVAMRKSNDNIDHKMLITWISFADEVNFFLIFSSLFSFSNVLKKKCRLSLPVVLFINSVKNRCISNTLSTSNWQRFLPTEFLLLNDVLFAPLEKSLAGMYNINEKNSNIKITGRTFPENLNGKL